MSSGTTVAADGASRRVRLLATAMWVFYAAGMTATLLMRAAAHVGVWQAFMITFTAFATVGWLIAVRRPSAPLGWLFLGIGALTSVGVVSDGVIGLGLHRGWAAHGLVLLSAWVQMWFWYPLLMMSTAYTLLLFPNGLPSRRWRPVLWVLTIALVAMVVTAAVNPQLEYGSAKIANPIGIASGWKDVEKSPPFDVAGLVLIGCLVASVISLGIRFRRSRGRERAQLKWFCLGGALLGALVVASLLSPSFNDSTVAALVTPFVFSAMPVSCGIAILRYRLYDIDRIVSRAVSYSLMTGGIVAVYVGAVALADGVLGFSSSAAVAASTLTAAALFQPMRGRLQRTVDRRFDRAAYNAKRTVDDFSNRLRDQVDVDAVCRDLLATVSSAVAPTRTSLWLVRP